MIRTWVTRLVLALYCVVVMFGLVGCAQNGASTSDYLLNASRPAHVSVKSSDAILEVRRLSIGGEFAGRGLVYRIGDFQFETDAYLAFLISPAQMITERTRDWLARSGVFKEVLVQGSRLRPTHVLEGNILGLYGDFRDPSAPTAVLEMRCFLIAEDGATQDVVLARDYRSVTPLAGDNTESFITALNACFVDVLTSLEADLSSSVSKTGS